VRERTPEPSHPVTSTDMVATMSRAQLQLRVGTVVLAVVPVLALPVVYAAPAADLASSIATIVLTVVVVLSLLLLPRAANGAIQRWVPRAAAAAVALEFCIELGVGESSAVGLLVATGILFVALLIAAASIPLSRGARSIGFSRFADVVEALTTALSFPAAFVAAGLIEIVRGMIA
jgi:hypothetical protein